MEFLRDVSTGPEYMKSLQFTIDQPMSLDTRDARFRQSGINFVQEEGRTFVEGENGRFDLAEQLARSTDPLVFEARLREVMSPGEFETAVNISSKSFKEGGFVTTETAARLEQSSNQVVADAKADPNNPMTNGFGQKMKDAVTGALKDMYDYAKETTKNNIGTWTKYALIGGLTYEVLDKMARSNNGCWLANKNTGELVKKIGGEDMANSETCVCSGKAPAALPPSVATDRACWDQCNYQGGGDPANTYVINWPLCGGICACSKYYPNKPADQQLVLASPQYELKVVKTDIWGVLSSFVSTVGLYVRKITDTVIDIAEAGVSAFTKFMNNIGWYLVGAIGVVILIVIILAIVDASKKKQGQPGIFVTKEPFKGGGFGEWFL